jgi:hypothetical protein
MRKMMAVVLGAALAMPMLVAQPVAARPERAESRSYNAFWHLRQRVDRDTYRRITWYAGVYESREGFWSDLYRSVQICERGPGRDRCRSGPYLVGVIEDLGDGTFEMDSGLDSGYFEATYPMELYKHREERRYGRIRIAVELTGTGDLTRYTERSTYEEGCYRVRYSSSWEYRQAIAAGVLTFNRTGETLDVGNTDDANMGQGRWFQIDHSSC